MSKLLQTSWTYTLNSMEQMPNWPFWIINLSFDSWTCYRDVSVLRDFNVAVSKCWLMRFAFPEGHVSPTFCDRNAPLQTTQWLFYSKFRPSKVTGVSCCCRDGQNDSTLSSHSLAEGAAGSLFVCVCVCVCQTSHSVQWTGKQAAQMTPYFRLQFIPRQGAAGKMELSGR